MQPEAPASILTMGSGKEDAHGERPGWVARAGPEKAAAAHRPTCTLSRDSHPLKAGTSPPSRGSQDRWGEQGGRSLGQPSYAPPTPGLECRKVCISDETAVQRAARQEQKPPYSKCPETNPNGHRRSQGRKAQRAGGPQVCAPEAGVRGSLMDARVTRGSPVVVHTAEIRVEGACGPRAGWQTHLTVLRDLHLLPLRHLGDV